MTMPFHVAHAAELQEIKPGMRIRFHLRGSSRIADIQKIRHKVADLKLIERRGDADTFAEIRFDDAL